MSEPLIDILMATYNGEKFVAEQIESIQNQTYTNWRLLVSDDCSSDGTLDIVKSMSAEDSRISIVLEGERFGSAKGNFDALLRIADSEYVMFCDQDDVWNDSKIALTLQRMQELERQFGDNAPLLVFTDMEVVNTDLILLNGSFEKMSNIDPTRIHFCEIIGQSVAAGCTIMINKHLADLHRSVPLPQEAIMHDWWLTLIASAFGHIGHVDAATSKYRQHDSNSVGAVAYSPLEKALSINAMTLSVQATIHQAQSFLKAYSDRELSPRARKSLYEYACISSTHNPFSRLRHLFKSKAWKKGLPRKIGQIISILSLKII